MLICSTLNHRHLYTWHLYTRSSAVVLTTATVCLPVPVTTCYRSFNVSRMSLPANLVTGTRKYEHISPVLRQLHWLPIRQRTIQGRCTGPQVSTRRRSTVSRWPLCTSVVVLQPLPAAVNWRCIYCTSRGHGQVTVTEVLLYVARQSGTVCLLAYVPLTLLQLFVDS